MCGEEWDQPPGCWDLPPDVAAQIAKANEEVFRRERPEVAGGALKRAWGRPPPQVRTETKEEIE